VIISDYDVQELIYAAKVRNGFVPRVPREVWQKLKRLEIAACSFANLPEKKRTQWALAREEMKNRVWLKPEFVAQIQLLSGRLMGTYAILSLWDCGMIKIPSSGEGVAGFLDCSSRSPLFTSLLILWLTVAVIIRLVWQRVEGYEIALFDRAAYQNLCNKATAITKRF
jgi:hypothetical protein